MGRGRRALRDARDDLFADAITVRTLVNSHLTLFAEMGAFVGGAWLAFIALALCVGRKLRRTWVAFAGLALSAFSASVFDWHVLFNFVEKSRRRGINVIWRSFPNHPHDVPPDSLHLAKVFLAEYRNPLYTSRLAELWRK